MLRTLSIAALLSFCSVVQAEDPTPVNKVIHLGPKKMAPDLDSPTEVEYLDTTLSDIVNDLKLRHRIEIEVDWEAVGPVVGLPEDAQQFVTFTCSLKDVSLASALSHILNPHGLTWAVYNDVVMITSVEKESKYVLTKAYQVSDFNDSAALQRVITSTIEMPSWQSAGGSVGAIAQQADTKMLIVTHTARTHRHIAQLINTLRAVKAEEKK